MKETARGFTLAEMIVASFIFVLVSVSLASVLAAGLKLWKRVAFDQPVEVTALALAEMAERREEALRFSPLELPEPEEDKLVLIGFVRDVSGKPRIGEIRYEVSPERKLLRRERAYGEALEGTDERVFEVTSPVDGLNVQPLYFNEWTGEFQREPVLGEISEEMEPKPDALRIALKFQTKDGRSHVLERVIRV